jgi:hypothetical protein
VLRRNNRMNSGEYRRHADGDQCHLCESASDKRRKPEHGERGFLPRTETAREIVRGKKAMAGANSIMS